MTSQEIAAFSIANDFYLWGGIILGFIFSASFKTILNIFANRIQQPRRIRFRNMNGRHERKDNFEYLYLFKGEYYTLEQRDFLLKERLNKIKSESKSSTSLFVVLSFSIICLLVYCFYLSNQIFQMKLGF